MIIGDIQWIAPHEIAGWCHDTLRPQTNLDVSLSNTRSDNFTRYSAQQPRDNLHLLNQGNVGYSIPLDAQNYADIGRLVVDSVHDIGVRVHSNHDTHPLYVPTDIMRSLRLGGLAESAIRYEDQDVVRIRDDGRIYLLHGSNENKAYLSGEKSLSPDVEAYWLRRIKELTHVCSEHGKQIIFVVVCAKETLEFAGSDFFISPHRPVLRLLRNLESAYQSNVLYNHTILKNLFPSERKFIANDTHMNSIGVYATYQMLCSEIPIPRPYQKSINDIQFFGSFWEGDLGRNTSTHTHCLTIDMEVHDGISVSYDHAQPLLSSQASAYHDTGYPRHVAVYGHSTALMLFQLIKSSMMRTDFIRRLLPRSFHEIQDYDTVICVIPERYLPRVLEN